MKINKVIRDWLIELHETKRVYLEGSGTGMSPDEFNNIKTNGSSGLGLSIALAILEEHNFEISCDEVKTGTKLRIKLK